MTRKRKHYKFTKRKKSVRGIIALFLSAASAVIFALVVVEAFKVDGNGSVYLGSVGVFSLLLSVASFVLAVLAVKEEDTFKTIPYVGLALSVIMSLLWVAVYVAGFLL